MANFCVISGRLGKDPMFKEMGGDNAVANFSIATEEKWRDKDGHNNSKTEWVPIVAWGALARICHKYLTTGREVLVFGKFTTQRWEKDGHKFQKSQIIASKIEFQAGGPRKGMGEKVGPAGETKPEGFESVVVGEDGDDSIPF